jgi:hypothetical protein
MYPDLASQPHNVDREIARAARIAAQVEVME